MFDAIDKNRISEYLEFLSKGKAADAGLILGDKSSFKATVDKATGFLTAPVKLARIGVQNYFGFELGLVDRALDKIGVFRSADEVFNPESVKSFINLVVTDDHPDEPVTADNVKDLQKGQVSQVEPDTAIDVLNGIITITDKDQIKKIQDGKAEVSVGYAYELVDKKGKFDGVDYEFVQTDIRANHLAIVDAGRCGSACKITMDKKKEKLVKITILGIDYDVENTQLAQAIDKQQSAFDAEKEKMEKKAEEDELELEKLKKEKEAAEGSKDAAEKLVLKDDDLNKLVADRAVLIAGATAILGDKMPECTDCPREIKAAVVDKVLDMGDLSKKSDDYITAAYDMALVKFKKSSDSMNKLVDDFKTNDGKKLTREEAQKKYQKDHLKIVSPE